MANIAKSITDLIGRTPLIELTKLTAGLEARGTRLGYEIATRRILLDGEEPLSLATRHEHARAFRGSCVTGHGFDRTPAL